MPGARPKKLRARDEDDLKVIAALLQDALVPIGETAFLRAEKRFVLVANRFMWEHSPKEAPPKPPPAGPNSAEDVAFAEDGPAAVHRRTNCALTFDRVVRVRFRGIDRRSKHQILNLLTIEAGPGHVDLLFSDGAAIRLDVSALVCHLEDLGEPWPTPWRPDHALDEGDGPD